MARGRTSEKPIRRELTPEENLWASTVIQAVDDAATTSAAMAYERGRARRWLTEPTADLHFVLSYCNMNLLFWHQVVVPKLRGDWATMADLAPKTGRTAESYVRAAAVAAVTRAKHRAERRPLAY